MLVVISGLPGTGKSTVAAALASRARAVHLSVDQVEDAMLAVGLAHDWTTDVAAYETVRAAAEQNLALGHLVVVDAVNDSKIARCTWQHAATATGAAVIFVLLTPPPQAEHRQRLTNRDRGFSYLPEPTWEQVETRAEAYEPWDDDCVVIDSTQSIEVIVDQIHAAVADAQ